MSNITPMMAQYFEIKANYPDALLFYRMGDFYEMFFDDAVAAAAALDIALTKRGKHGDNDIPMCGVPAHSADSYLLTLIKKGFRVAVCEQLENPAEAKKRGAKSVVKRDVVRLVTPGTITEETLLSAKQHNYLASFSQVRDDFALAWVDISTGAFHVMTCPLIQLGPELARLGPREVVVADQSPNHAIITDSGAAVTELGKAAFDSQAGEKRLCAFFKIATSDAFANFTRAQISAMSAILEYLEITQKGNLPLLRPPVLEAESARIRIDAATRKSLELTQSMNGGRAGSLLDTIDRTLTAGGGRLLEQRISAPERDLTTIQLRQDRIAYFCENSLIRDTLRQHLKGVHDIDRALSRLALDRGGARDLAAVRNTILQAQHIVHDLPDCAEIDPIKENLTGQNTLYDLLNSALVAEPPLLIRDGGFIAEGYDPELDDVRNLRDKGRKIIIQFQEKYITETGIQSLKIKHNNVLGYFIETTSTHAEKMLAPPLNAMFIHRQTTANQVRFTTAELSELETRILNAAGQALEIEKRLYLMLKESVLHKAAHLSQLARALAELDVMSALAELADNENWTRPVIDMSRDFAITGGRHPVVELALKKAGTPFVANDCNLNDRHIWLLTGPNMAGKSTFLRQNALIAILAQTGSFVPAQSAKIGIISQIFSRVGASDDLARGRSTFMVEMVETAAILNQADDRALVILDEIGRGTSTYDGLSIAWATLEHLHNVNRCRALFATHYHEMCQLSEKLDGVDNATVTVREWEGDVIFLHEVQRGTADRSYGVQVARLAGLPATVIERAKTILNALEKGEREKGEVKALIDDLPLFSAVQSTPVQAETPSELEKRLEDISPDDLSPKQALTLIYELKALSGRR